MRYLLIILITSFSTLKAQFFGSKSVSISQSFIQFNEPFLANKTNTNNRNSWINEIEKSKSISNSSFFNIHYGIGMGSYNNLDNKFEYNESSNFIRLRGNLSITLPEIGTNCDHCHKTPHILNPYFKIGYLIDKLNSNFKNKSGSYFCTSMNFGGGLVLKLTNYIGLNYDFSINQRINNDYRTFSQHKFGLVVNLSKKYNNNF